MQSDLIDFSKRYFDLLNGPYAGINLTRINDFDSFYRKQILDSVIPVSQSTEFFHCIQNASQVVDVGFGGGFPLLVLAYLFPDKPFVGIESVGKKAKVVKEIAERLNIKNVSFHHGNLMNFNFVKTNTMLTFKAVGRIEDYLELINSDVELSAFFYKGSNFFELEGESLKDIKSGWKQICYDQIILEGAEGRFIVGFKKSVVPRGTILKNNSKNKSESTLNKLVKV